ncbi:hypothetical protein NP493_2066g00006 [Ridgeia piscesae]|uniref:Chitin-binding type-2 domain-containing protein n=1 Tax=Ridgeia piscesae TaxID=27915 RepID=A0AAD9N3M6_RIDPI|nr:hypothetical protein NP493_2066g00006 [Ridgeia piscesae]
MVRYHYCSDYTHCFIRGFCRKCQDSCYGKPDGDYPSLDNPRPFYYHCENGFLFYTTCYPNEVFNAWTRKCDCYEVFCKKGDGYQPSVCGNRCGGYVMCEGGFAKFHRHCPRPRPYFSSLMRAIVRYHYCGESWHCLIKGVCRKCQDSCHGKRDGDYPSLDNPRPFYYHCQNGHISYTTCHPKEIFNAWTRKCECYEVYCEKGYGYQPSVYGNRYGFYVKCEGGFAYARFV